MNRRTPRIAFGLCVLLLALVGYFRLSRPPAPAPGTFVRVRELAAVPQPRHRIHHPRRSESVASRPHPGNGSDARDGRIAAAPDIYDHSDEIDRGESLRDGTDASSDGLRHRSWRHRGSLRRRRWRHSTEAASNSRSAAGSDRSAAASDNPPAAASDDRPSAARGDDAGGTRDRPDDATQSRGDSPPRAGRSDGTWERYDAGAGSSGDTGADDDRRGGGDSRKTRDDADRSVDPGDG